MTIYIKIEIGNQRIDTKKINHKQNEKKSSLTLVMNSGFCCTRCERDFRFSPSVPLLLSVLMICLDFVADDGDDKDLTRLLVS